MLLLLLLCMVYIVESQMDDNPCGPDGLCSRQGECQGARGCRCIDGIGGEFCDEKLPPSTLDNDAGDDNQGRTVLQVAVLPTAIAASILFVCVMLCCFFCACAIKKGRRRKDPAYFQDGRNVPLGRAIRNTMHLTMTKASFGTLDLAGKHIDRRDRRSAAAEDAQEMSPERKRTDAAARAAMNWPDEAPRAELDAAVGGDTSTGTLEHAAYDWALAQADKEPVAEAPSLGTDEMRVDLAAVPLPHRESEYEVVPPTVAAESTIDVPSATGRIAAGDDTLMRDTIELPTIDLSTKAVLEQDAPSLPAAPPSLSASFDDDEDAILNEPMPEPPPFDDDDDDDDVPPPDFVPLSPEAFDSDSSL